MKKTFITTILMSQALFTTAKALSADNTPSHSETPTIATDDTLSYDNRLQGVTVKSSATRRMAGALNGMQIGRDELFKAACCNLGESFTTNPSVDVSYSDAATGAKQIKLLGLSGTYVQMLTETMPNYRTTALPYALGYVPGPWMKAIQVSKGCASVKNGYESITGQINIDYLKPEDEPHTELNLYGDTKSRIEANATSNFHINKRLSTELLLHYEDSWKKHDDNADGFIDKPAVRQGNLQSRWAYLGDRNIFHGGISILKEKRDGGQTTHNHAQSATTTDLPLFTIGIETNRYEAYLKHAFVLNKAKGTNIALMASATMHEQKATYGYKLFNANDKNVYASLMYETNFTKAHNLSAGLSLNYDYISQTYRLEQNQSAPTTKQRDRETVPGAYAQYTFDWNHRLTAMAGFRIDHSSLYGTFLTPRFNVKYMPADFLTVRLSAGKGYRTPHPLAENNYLMASGRTLIIGETDMEEAWNYGATAAFTIPLWDKDLKLNLEYFYTHFLSQSVIDYDTNPHAITISSLQGRSYSHTLQADATYTPIEGLSVTAAYRLNDVRCTYGGILMQKPLTSKYKALLSLSYKTPLELWQFDCTLQLNGGGRLPQSYTLADGTPSWSDRFSAFEQLSAQVTRVFRHFSVYVGGENLTNFKQKNPILNADRPWSTDFEPTLVWGPVHGAMVYAGVRVEL